MVRSLPLVASLRLRFLDGTSPAAGDALPSFAALSLEMIIASSTDQDQSVRPFSSRFSFFSRRSESFMRIFHANA